MTNWLNTYMAVAEAAVLQDGLIAERAGIVRVTLHTIYTVILRDRINNPDYADFRRLDVKLDPVTDQEMRSADHLYVYEGERWNVNRVNAYREALSALERLVELPDGMRLELNHAPTDNGKWSTVVEVFPAA